MDDQKRERIRAAILRNPAKPNHVIAKSLYKVLAGDVEQVKKELGGMTAAAASEAVESAGLSGVSLTQKRVLSRRPAESAAKYIKRLPNNKGFHPSDLAREWGMSEETIRKHARDMGCIKFVEVSEDEWKPLIMAPETAARYPS
jgi:hypothetical protein